MNKITGEILNFIQNKDYTFQRYIGQGGTGTTILVKDEVTDFYFVCKKYAPYDKNKKKEYFHRFIDEIKIMYPLSHKNIVRIYNYFLYSEHTTGYILMEFIEGSTIDEFLLWQSEDLFEDVFIQLIDAFTYLEKNNVLHRDIRNANILVTISGVVKVIDFGFGKKIDTTDKNDASILLNWPVSDFPDEIYQSQYNSQTEVYFVGKLFNRLLEDNDMDNFRYKYIIDKMIIQDSKKRIGSFLEVQESISRDIFEDYDFSEEERLIYINFAENMVSHIIAVNSELKFVENSKELLNSLQIIIKECLLEEYLQDNSKLISCFVKSGYRYKLKKEIPVSCIREFYRMFLKFPTSKQDIVLTNIVARLKTISIFTPDIEEDDIPF